MSELKKPKKIKLIKLDGYKDIAHRNVGEKTVDGRGYEPYEAVKYFFYVLRTIIKLVVLFLINYRLCRMILFVK